MNKESLLKRKSEIEEELRLINTQLTVIGNLEKPYVANVSAYSGNYSMQFKKEEQARKNVDGYGSKKYFKNRFNYEVYLYKLNDNEKKTLLEVIPKGRENFEPSRFL